MTSGLAFAVAALAGAYLAAGLLEHLRARPARRRRPNRYRRPRRRARAA